MQTTGLFLLHSEPLDFNLTELYLGLTTCPHLYIPVSNISENPSLVPFSENVGSTPPPPPLPPTIFPGYVGSGVGKRCDFKV